MHLGEGHVHSVRRETPLFDEQTGEPLNSKAAKLLGRKDHAGVKYKSSGHTARFRGPHGASMFEGEAAMAGFGASAMRGFDDPFSGY